MNPHNSTPMHHGVAATAGPALAAGVTGGAGMSTEASPSTPPCLSQEDAADMWLTEVEEATPPADIPWPDILPIEVALPSTKNHTSADNAYNIMYNLLSSVLLPQQSVSHLYFLDNLFYLATAEQLDESLPEVQSLVLHEAANPENLMDLVLPQTRRDPDGARSTTCVETVNYLVENRGEISKFFNKAPSFSIAARDSLIADERLRVLTHTSSIWNHPLYKTSLNAAKANSILQEKIQEAEKIAAKRASNITAISENLRYISMLADSFGHIAQSYGVRARNGLARAVINCIHHGMRTGSIPDQNIHPVLVELVNRIQNISRTETVASMLIKIMDRAEEKGVSVSNGTRKLLMATERIVSQIRVDRNLAATFPAFEDAKTVVGHARLEQEISGGFEQMLRKVNLTWEFIAKAALEARNGAQNAKRVVTRSQMEKTQN